MCKQIIRRSLFFFSAAVMLGWVVSCNSGGSGLFQQLGASATGIEFTNTLYKAPRFNILYYLYYYNGGGVAVGDINNDGLTDIYFTANHTAGNKLYLNKGDFKFEDITEKAGVAGSADWSTGATMADVNGDGLMDIYTCVVGSQFNLKGRNELFINQGNGRFEAKGAEYGLDFSGLSTQAAFFDYDHDGDLDMYLLNHSKKPHSNIVPAVNRSNYDSISGDRLYRHDVVNGKIRFTDVSREAGIYQSNLGYGLGISVADFNNDGWEDIYIGNDFHENDYYYLNSGNGTFTEQGAEHFGHYSRFSMGNDAADYNNDGHIDIITVDMLPPDEKVLKTYGSDENPDIYMMKLIMRGYQHQYSKNCLQKNNGNGTSFSENSLLSGVSATDWSWSPLFADFDNDGNKDLFVSSGIVKRPVDLDYVMYVSDMEMRGLSKTDKYDDEVINKMPDGASHPFFFKGDGSWKFTDVSESWGTAKMKGYFNGSAYADLNNDGKLDVVINQLEGKAVVLKNNSDSRGFITLGIKGDSLNTSGIGSKAFVYQGGKMQFQHLMPTRGFQSSVEHRLHFGVDSTKKIDSIVVLYPGGASITLKDVKANQFLVLEKKNFTGFVDASSLLVLPPEILAVDSSSGISTRHIENDFFDHNSQYLIPHAMSTRGPKIAVGDVNNDGLDDYYLCGSKGKPGFMMIQGKDGNFSASDTALFLNEAWYEDVDAVFFDADNNGTKDLYVVSGGNEYNNQSQYLLDRLYLNDGKGHFTKSSGALPGFSENKSCVTVADVDKDGDQDLFVGTLASSYGYGIPQTSYLLMNDGKGKFSVNDKIASGNIGMVTSASFSDLNNDSWPDLIVTGEWMPLMIYMNNKGSFTHSTIPNSTGLWQSVFVEDMNGDGNADFVAGNWGWNNKFWSGKNGAVKLYVSDFDKNGKIDQLLSYTLNGVEYPFLAKDEVERALPVLKKHYLKYSEYAGVPMKDVFYGWVDTMKPFIAERLGSVIAFGDGKGGFILKDLPVNLQLAPLFSFARISTGTYIAGGNFYNVIPYEGRYDAQPLAIFTVKGNEVSEIPQPNLQALRGQVRDCKWINTPAGRKLIVARNHDKLITYHLKQ